MPVGRVTLIGSAVLALLYVMLDSGMVSAERAPTTTSLGLGILAVIFAVGGWGAWVAGWRERAPLLVGIAAGAGVYALLRLAAF